MSTECTGAAHNADGPTHKPILPQGTTNAEEPALKAAIKAFAVLGVSLIDQEDRAYPVPDHTATREVAHSVDAQWYASEGWRVVWAPRGMKRPTMSGWPNRATTDPDTITRWWSKTPDANVCITTGQASNLWVLDIDDRPAWRGKPAKEGSRTLADLEAQYGQLPETYTVKTRAGGLHLYWTWNGVDFNLGNSAGGLGPDLDTRGNGGQVVAPPSYAREDDSGPAGYYEVASDVPPVPAPQWLVDMLRPKPRETYVPPQSKSDEWSWVDGEQPQRMGDIGRRFAGILNIVLRSEGKDGVRNRSLYSAAGLAAEMVERGDITREQAETALAKAADHVGLTATEVPSTIRSAFKRHAREGVRTHE